MKKFICNISGIPFGGSPVNFRKWLSPIIILFLTFFTSCQKPVLFDDEISIQGKVFNTETGEGIPGAAVSTIPPTSTVATDNNGYYKIKNVSPGMYKIKAEKNGFVSSEVTVKVVDQDVTADIGLSPVKPVLSVSSKNLDFGTDINEKSVTLRNIGTGVLNWSGTKNASWLQISPNSGSLSAGASVEMIAKVNRGGLQPGNYSDVIKLTSNGGNEEITVNMVVANQIQPQLSVSPKSLEFKANENEKVLTLMNIGKGGSIKWQGVPDRSWITLSRVSGEFTNSDTVKVMVNRTNLNDGVYQGKINFTSNAGPDEVSITMWVQKGNPVLSVYPDSLDFDSTKTLLFLYISNAGSGILSWSATASHNWINLFPTEGTNNAQIEVRVNRNLLYAGFTYRGYIQITSNGGDKQVGVKVLTPSASKYEAQVDSLKIILESFKRISNNEIAAEITFWNLSDLQGGKKVRVYVPTSESYLIDENAWRWSLTGDSEKFTSKDPWYENSGRTLDPGTKLKSKFYFKPDQNSSGIKFKMKLNILYCFGCSKDWDLKQWIVVFENLTP